MQSENKYTFIFQHHARQSFYFSCFFFIALEDVAVITLTPAGLPAKGNNVPMLKSFIFWSFC